jgi:dipeptidyl aminopeptidase/acylaminoacyl peptidase
MSFCPTVRRPGLAATLLCAVLAPLVSEATARAEPPPLIPRKVLFGNPDKANPQVSPDGKRLAYLAPDDKGVMNVWVRTLGKDDDQVVTSDKKRGIRGVFWQGDSRCVLYMQDEDGDENFHAFQTDAETKNTRDLTPFKGVRAIPADVNPQFPDQALLSLNLRDRRFYDVYRVNLKNGAVELDTPNPGDAAGFETDNAMRVRIAQVQQPDGGTELRIRDDGAPASAWRTLTRWGPDETFGGVAGFTPDNKGVYLISSVDANAARLVEWDLASGKSKVVAEDPRYDVGRLLVHPRTQALQAVAFTRERTEWKVIDPSIEDDFRVLSKLRDGDFVVASRDLDDKTWVVSYTMDDGPAYYYLYDRPAKKASLLFSNLAALEKQKLAKMKPVSFDARDGLALQGYLTLPAGAEPKNLPTVLLVHGGPWGRDTWGLHPEVQWLANRGYAVLQVNFRGSTGYGKTFLNAGDREWAGKMHTDLLDAKKWAIAQGFADPKKVAIMGGSYGGYATLVGLAFTPDEFVCGVDIVGPSNLVTLRKTIPPYWTPVVAMWNKRMGSVETEEDFLKSRSPLHKADRIKAPLLIGQGANDPRVKQAESDQIVEAMRKNGKEVEYLVFPDEGHGFARPQNRLKFYAAAEAFLAKHLGGRAEPPAEGEKADELRK